MKFVIPGLTKPVPYLIRENPGFIDTGSLLSQGRRLDSRFCGNDALSFD
jgi:hypothetical protein